MEVAVPVSWPVPEAAVTVFSTPDDACCETRNMKSDFAVNICILLHLVGSLLTLTYDARNRELKNCQQYVALRCTVLCAALFLWRTEHKHTYTWYRPTACFYSDTLHTNAQSTNSAVRRMPHVYYIRLSLIACSPGTFVSCPVCVTV